MKRLVRVVLGAVLAAGTAAASGVEPLAAWTLWPDHRLPRKAGIDADLPAPYATPLSSPAALSVEAAPLLLDALRPSEHLGGLLPAQRLPDGAFSIELWLVDHANVPLGLMAAAAQPGGERRIGWRLSYQKQRLAFGPPEGGAQWSTDEIEGWQGYWHHLVGVWDGAALRLYHNGERVAEESAAALPLPAGAALELDAWLGAEPGARLADFVHELAIYGQALDAAQVRAAFEQRKQPVTEGRRYATRPHFTAGPYLNAVDTGAVSVLWETDRPRAAVLEWGASLPLRQRVEIAASGKRLQQHRIEGLEPGRPYFYRLRITTGDGEAALDSGTLSFRTAVPAGTPLRFIATGDTEARPWINRRLAGAAWAERPDFLLICGDLTDGGRAEHRWQWTHEYFPGLAALIARVPVIAAPGNGEGDLVWFRHYHALPGDEGYYRYRYGDVEFFVLDSNLREREQREPGFRARQRAWLDAALADSDARWKIAAHHHAPYSSDEDDYGDTWAGAPSTLGDPLLREDLVPIYEKHRLDAVLYGHLHSYERTRPLRAGRIDEDHGIVYLQLGGAGGNLEDFSPTRAPFSRKVFRDHHYAVVDVDGARMSFAVYDLEGRLRDRFDLEK
ncbi:MAG: metallophosphoesterase [Pseudomonadota bacterium]